MKGKTRTGCRFCCCCLEMKGLEEDSCLKAVEKDPAERQETEKA